MRRTSGTSDEERRVVGGLLDSSVRTDDLVLPAPACHQGFAGHGAHGELSGLRLHQLRHSSATHLGEANTSAKVIMAKTGHKSLRTVQRYVKPGLAAVHQATEALSGPRRRG